MIAEENYFIIDTLIRQGRSFAMWRVPGEETIHFRMQTLGSPDLLFDLNELNGRSGFVIAPFHVSTEHPIVLLQPDCFEMPEDVIESPQEMINVCAPATVPPVRSMEEEKLEYSRCFQTFLSQLQKKELDKLVLSRPKTILKEAGFSVGKVFFRACRRYIYSYVYLCHTPQTGTWLGGTPEIILSGEGNEWHTIALAGTQQLIGDELPKEWDAKNIQEQQYVAQYIRNRLNSLGIMPEENGPYTSRAVDICHLRSDFCFRLPNNRELGTLLDKLHPTPAVCGLPKDKAYRFILEHEGYDRRYYSGFVGWLAPHGKTDLYVNLRCMSIQRDTYTLFAGGGLLESSLLESEWKETNDKMQTMRKIID